MSKHRRGARGNPKISKPKGPIKQPNRDPNRDEPSESKDGLSILANAPLTGDAPEVSGQSKRQNRANGTQDGRKIMWLLKAIWRPLKWFFGMCDRHNGGISALATVAIMGLTVFYVGYSKKQWETMDNSLRASERFARIDQRAWVTFSRFVLSEEVNEHSPFYVTGTIINTGKTPAVKAITKIAVAFSMPAVTEDPKEPTGGITNLFFVAPNTTPEFSTEDYTPSTWEIDAYRKNGFLFVKQTVWYWDIFGTPHWTTTCRWHQYLRPLNEFGFCAWGNAIDHNEPQR